jgi:hypothetical protein
MNDELVRMWLEAVVAYHRILSRHLPGGLRKTTKYLRTVGVLKPASHEYNPESLSPEITCSV